MIKRKKKTERQKLVDELDRVFSLFIRARDKYSVFSGSSENLCCFHIFSRVSYSTRWDEHNAVCSTKGENASYEHDTYFINKVHNWYIDKYGAQFFELMHKKAHSPVKYSNSDLKLLIQDFKNKLKELQES
jgi:hypothetical protein